MYGLHCQRFKDLDMAFWVRLVEVEADGASTNTDHCEWVDLLDAFLFHCARQLKAAEVTNDREATQAG